MKIEELDLEIPDDDKEIEVLKKEIDNLGSRIKYYYNKKIDKEKKEKLRQEVEDVIYCIADLSIPYFRINEPLREFYLKKHKSEPIKGRDLFLERYGELHKPYDTLKNKCYILFRNLEKLNIKE